MEKMEQVTVCLWLVGVMMLGSVTALPKAALSKGVLPKVTLPSATVSKVPRYSHCGDQIHLPVGGATFFQSPGYSYGQYASPISCSWFATSPTNTIIRLTCPSLSIRPSLDCSMDVLKVYTSLPVVGSPYHYFCGTTNTPIDIFSDDSYIYATFTATSYYNYYYNYGYATYPGFHCNLTVVPLPVPVSPECGVRGSSRIVGGQPVPEGKWPWQVALRYKSTDVTVTDQIFCGGALVTNQWVLTAAHCATQSKETYVSLGFHSLSLQSHPAFTVNITVADVIIHENYDFQTLDNDIALLKLSEAVSYTSSIRPICMPCEVDSDALSGMIGTVTGWGVTTYGGTVSTVLQEVELPLLTTVDCQKSLHNNVTTNMICTYKFGHDSCQGDSGGPLTVADKGRDFLVGLVSFGFKCAQLNTPGVFTKVTNYIKWIENKTDFNFCSQI